MTPGTAPVLTCGCSRNAAEPSPCACKTSWDLQAGRSCTPWTAGCIACTRREAGPGTHGSRSCWATLRGTPRRAASEKRSSKDPSQTRRTRLRRPPACRPNLGADLRRLHEWWRRRRSFRACSGSPFVRAGRVSDRRAGRFPSGIYAVTVEGISDGFLSWRRLIAGDLPMLAEWLREPQVARWWNHETTLEAVKRDFGASTRGEE